MTSKADENTPLVRSESTLEDDGPNEIDVWDPYDPLNYIGGKRGIMAFTVIVVLVVSVSVAVAVAEHMITVKAVLHTMLTIGIAIAAFLVMAAVIVGINICYKMKLHEEHHAPVPYESRGKKITGIQPYECPVNMSYKANVTILWTPTIFELCKDLFIVAFITWTLEDGMLAGMLRPLARELPASFNHFVSAYTWLFFLGASVFVLQRCSWQDKRRWSFIIGMPIIGFFLLFFVDYPRVQKAGFAILWGTLLETTTAVFIWSKPAWCVHYSDKDAETLAELMPKLRTGDVFVFTGCESSSTLIRFFTGGDWSHVAILLRDPPLALKEKLAPMEHLESGCPVWLLEADPEYVDFVRGGKLGHTGGVQLVPLDNYVENLEEWYQGKHVVAVRHLIMPGDKDRNQPVHGPLAPEEQKNTWEINFPGLQRWLMKHGDNAYESSSWSLFRASIKNNKNYKKIDELFCSELVAQCYMAMGLLSKNISSDNYSPRDFSSFSPWNLNLQRGAGLALERRILP